MPTRAQSDDRSTLGPVEVLDEHVPDEWWQDLFGETYLLTDGDVLSDRITRREVDRFIDRAALQPQDRILDLCCGQGRHTIELARRGYRHLQGLDQSTYLIERAREAATRCEVDIPFHLGDARTLPFEDDAFDVVLLLGNSFGYFDATADDHAVLDEVRRVVKSGGRVLLDITDGDYTRKHFDRRSWEWADDQHLVCRERELADGDQRLVTREIIIDAEHGVKKDQFYSERLYGRRGISRLLQDAGFCNVVFASLAGESERNADLGMMAQRFVVTVQAPAADSDGASQSLNALDELPHDSRPPQKASPAASNHQFIAVVLGDPRRHDETKLGGTFDSDDYEVIDRLRTALSGLSEYECMYFDNHDTLLDDLRTYGDAVDLILNLCDEGFRNNPRQELHVPALLEILDIPYSGAGPQCLGPCYDKSLIRGVAREMGIPVADGYLLHSGAAVPDDLPIPYPVIVKPNAADNSAGMTTDCIATSPGELEHAIQSVRDHVGASRPLLIEEFLTGADLTYGVIGNPAGGFQSLPISEDDYSGLPDDLPPFCGYEAKWIPDSPYWTEIEAVPAVLPDAIQAQIQSDSHTLFERLGCRDYARFV
jgi:D-alanine-D-alanine ligase